ncbi:uncharacterized protein J3D65DRAFT_601452 [Phyllosticta citribraziliensis]|uniref:Uncharacterized protein n=1 Tax=Phyllosticta citribraziliensis TaxID=989973 RepID=A0ABR1LVZ6_9PEZI
MDNIEASEAAFTRDSERISDALAEAERFKKGETVRLNGFTTQLLHENEILRGNLSSGSPNISPEILTILQTAPMKSLPTPSTALFDEIMPELAGYEIDYDDDFHHHESYAKIITAFRRLQASENGLEQAAKIIQRLASENYILRLKNVALTSEDHQREFLRSHGKPFNAKVFRRKVPDHVSSKRPAESNNYFGAFNEFSGAHVDKALVLKELKEVPTASSTKTFYHPFHSRYIPSLWGMGVANDGDDPVWEEADEDQIYFLAGYINVGEPDGKKRWIPNVYDQGQMFNWALE